VLGFGLLLVIGLLGELARSKKWKDHLRTFEVMVILGVAGELIGDGGIFVFSERLQAISDTELALLNVEAGRFREGAANIERENLKLRAAMAPRETIN
jgi:hypothetical protein